MGITRKKVTLKEEKTIITNMIVSTEFLKRVRGVVQSSFMKSSYSRIIADWCWEYFDNTGSAPGRDVQDLYLRKRKDLRDEEEVELIREFLQKLSDEWDESQINNIKYAVDNAEIYMRLRSLELTQERLESALEEANPDFGEQIIANHKRLETRTGSGISILSDTEKIISAFEDTEEVLFSYPGDLGRAIGPFRRGDFCAIMGAPKVGKSWALWYTARRAALLGYKAIIMNFEMTENQYVRRSWQSMVGEPRRSGVVKIPYFEFDEDEEKYRIEYREERKEGVRLDQIGQKQDFYKKQLRGGEVRVESFIEGSSTFSDCVARLDNLEYYDNFVPDVIIWDYPDIMAPEIKGDERSQIDDIWKKIRGLAQARNCLCVGGSQVSANAWGKDIKGNDAAENKRKAAHITKMFALNQTDAERDQGVLRIQSLFEREGRRFTGQVMLLQCLEIGRFYIDSKLRRDVEDDSED